MDAPARTPLLEDGALPLFRPELLHERQNQWLGPSC